MLTMRVSRFSFTSAKEVGYVLTFIGLSLSGITHKVVERF